MADKQLDESTWKAFASKRELKGADLQKALAALAAAEKKGPQGVDAALDAVDKQIGLLQKEHKADKDVVKQLEAMKKASEADRKEAAKQAKAAAASAAEDEEEDTPVLLTTKMIPLVRQLKKGDVSMHAMIGTAGRNTAVLIMRKPIGIPRRKLLAEALDATGGAKYVVGECLWEAGALTFVLKTQAAGMAKRLRAALLAQTELRLKVRVRGEDPADIDEDGEDEEDAKPAATQKAAEKPAEKPAAAETAEPPHAALYRQRLDELHKRMADALKAQHPESNKLRAVSGFAEGKAEAGDFAGAEKALDMLQKLLEQPAATPEGADKAALDAALDGWRKARAGVLAQLKDMADELKEDRGEDPDDELARDAELEVNAVMKQLTAEPRTLQQVNELTRWVTQDDVVTDVDAYVGNVRAPLTTALAALRQAFGQPA
ncbi:hypothetical protein GT347_15415 [Xylophilus rhododendri]|uniref:Uncharacterized protein n=1 Tax=Xylophilus rhododendri TaxID=2697032 RepID=A0A857J8A5_9BURK|nr:hypothetical protein [Xylophilus rhododendri]QHI99242.1 hypothetical protein GT347_15415 [Xylophilus rhododendri]